MKTKSRNWAPRRVTAVVTEKFDSSLQRKLIELMEGHAGHAPFVLLARTIDIEVAKAHDLATPDGSQALKIEPAFTPHALVKQEFGVTVNVQWALKGRLLAERVRAAVSGSARGVQQPRSALAAGLEKLS